MRRLVLRAHPEAGSSFSNRELLHAYQAYLKALGATKTRSSMELRLDYALRTLIVDDSDKIGVRVWGPHLMLRLGRDQQCYEFIKSNSEHGHANDDRDLPAEHGHNAS